MDLRSIRPGSAGSGVDPWVDPGRLLGGGRRVDVLLGWTAEELGPAVVAGLDLGAAVVIGRPVPVATSPASATLGGPIGRPLPTGDPRLDPRSRSLIREQLAAGPWMAAYRRLILLAAGAEPGTIGEEPAGLPASIERPELAVDVSGVRRGRARSCGPSGRSSGTRPVDGTGPTGGLSILEAELIGATAVDAGPELRRAWAARRDRGDPAVEAALIAEPPPWPPASILGLRDGDEGEALLETLAGALVHDEEARAWLLTSWRSPTRPIDRPGAPRGWRRPGAVDLLREPLFLAWLRAEWTAWARQHFAESPAGPPGDRHDAVLIVEEPGPALSIGSPRSRARASTSGPASWSPCSARPARASRPSPGSSTGLERPDGRRDLPRRPPPERRAGPASAGSA